MTKTPATIITALLIASLSILGTACKTATPGTLPNHPAITNNGLDTYFPPAAPAVVTWPNDGQSHGDVVPPQRLDISGTERAECDDMGGTFRGPLEPGSLGTCEGVDY